MNIFIDCRERNLRSSKVEINAYFREALKAFTTKWGTRFGLRLMPNLSLIECRGLNQTAQVNAVTTGTAANLSWHAQKTLHSRDGEYLRVRFLVQTRRKASNSAVYLKLSEGAFTLVLFMAYISEHSTA